MLWRYALLSVLICASLTTLQAAEIRMHVEDSVIGKRLPCRVHLKEIGSEIGTTNHRVSRESAQFFLDWVHEREGKLKLSDPGQREEVMLHHRAGEKFWMNKLESAND